MKCHVPTCNKHGWVREAQHTRSGVRSLLCRKHYKEFTNGGAWVDPRRAIRKTAMEKGPEEDIGKAMTRYLKAEERIRELEAELAECQETLRDTQGWSKRHTAMATEATARAEKAEAGLKHMLEVELLLKARIAKLKSVAGEYEFHVKNHKDACCRSIVLSIEAREREAE